ncbi:putative transcriptional regulator [Mycobacterium xenopi 3993]|nr:putative transcriptional regulator [Mycobacterium xenopi 3993]
MRRFALLGRRYVPGGSAARCHGRKDFDAAWAEGAALSTEEAIAYAQRGRGERKRPASGWPRSRPPNATS